MGWIFINVTSLTKHHINFASNGKGIKSLNPCLAEPGYILPLQTV